MQSGPTPGFETDRAYMQEALAQARTAAAANEVPIGSVVVINGEIAGRGANRTRRDGIVTAHAELLALVEAESTAGDFRLDNAWLFVTVEPCLMCLGAIIQARVSRVVFGAREPKFGALFSRYSLAGHQSMRKVDIVEGVCHEESVALLQEFFAWLRNCSDETCKSGQ